MDIYFYLGPDRFSPDIRSESTSEDVDHFFNTNDQIYIVAMPKNEAVETSLNFSYSVQGEYKTAPDHVSKEANGTIVAIGIIGAFLVLLLVPCLSLCKVFHPHWFPECQYEENQKKKV